MTRRIYIEGDLGGTGCRFVDADTDTEILVTDFSATAQRPGKALIREITLGGRALPPADVELVPNPKRHVFKAGELLYALQVKRRDDPISGDVSYTATAEAWKCDSVGDLQPHPSKNLVSMRNADAHNLSNVQAHVVPTVLTETAKDAVKGLVDMLGAGLTGTVSTNPLQRGGVVFKATPATTSTSSKMIPLAPSSRRGTVVPIVSTPTCDECWGTGYFKGQGKPCSRGCKP